MAFVTISEWTSDHVVDWLKGLDDAILPYIQAFQNNDINGRRLLLITADDLFNLNVTKVGHQELILEAVDLLRQLNYSIDSENLQSIALKLGCKARGLYNDLKQDAKEGRKQKRVNTATLSAVSGILSTVKAMVSWLDRNPFEGQDQYVPIRKTILRLSIELASTAQRDQFAENPLDVIKNSALNLADLCDKVVQDLNDPLILQPAFIDVAHVRKEENEELGIHVQSSYSGVHIVGGVKFQSPAHRCSTISEGDEIIQVNYQTVVGWKLCKFVELLRDPVTEVAISLKKRPRHTNGSGQVSIMKPWGLPLKKKKSPKRCDSNSTSENNTTRYKPRKSVDKDDSVFLPNGNQVMAPTFDHQLNNDNQKPKVTLKRRVTVSGASPTVSRPPVRIEELYQPSKNKDMNQRNTTHGSSKTTKKPHRMSTSVLQTIESHRYEEGNNLRNLTKDVAIAKFSDKNCSSKSSVVKLKAKGIVLPNSEDEDNVVLCDKTILDELSHSQTDYGVSSDTRSTNADTGFVSLSESSDSMCDRSSNARSSPSLDTLSSSSCNSSYHESQNGNVPSKFPQHLPNTVKTQVHQDVESNKDYNPVNQGENIPLKYSPGKMRGKNPILRNKLRSKLVINRRISCKDLGHGDCQGWLYRRKVQKSILSSGKWTKRWFVLKNLYLYCYRDMNDDTAESLIFLPGFNVSPAPECKTKKYSFKAYHTGTTFYFATESQQDLSKWMNKMGLAAISYDTSSLITTSGFLKPEHNLSIGNLYYSETDDDCEDGSKSAAAQTVRCDAQSLANKKPVSGQLYMNVGSVMNSAKSLQENQKKLPQEIKITDELSAGSENQNNSSSPYMNVPMPHSISKSSSATSLDRPIPAKRNIPNLNRSHTYMNIPPSSPSYKLSHQQKLAKAKITEEKIPKSDETNSLPPAGKPKSSDEALKSSLYDSNNISNIGKNLDVASNKSPNYDPSYPCTHPYMNLPNPITSSNQVNPLQSSSSYSSLPDARCSRSEFFGMLAERCPPPSSQYKLHADNASKNESKTACNESQMNSNGYDSSHASLDRKELRDISPGLVARLTGSYNKLDNQGIVDNTPTSMSAVLSGKLKRRELSPGRVARITGSFDSLGRNGNRSGRHRQCSTSSLSSNSSVSSSRGRPMYQRSLSTSHPAICEIADQNQSKHLHSGGSYANLLSETEDMNSKPQSDERTSAIKMQEDNSEQGTYHSSDDRRYVSVPHGAIEFMNQYNNEKTPEEERFVSLVDREHRRLYGTNYSDENSNCCVPKSATSQQIQEIYSKMSSPHKQSKEPVVDQRLKTSCSDPSILKEKQASFSSSYSSDDYNTPMTSPAEASVDRNSEKKSCFNQSMSSSLYSTLYNSNSNLNSCQNSFANSSGLSTNSLGMMHAQYVQSPGTVITPVSSPPLDVKKFEMETTNFIQMGHVPGIQNSAPEIHRNQNVSSDFHTSKEFVELPAGTTRLNGAQLKISKVPSCEAPVSFVHTETKKIHPSPELSSSNEVEHAGSKPSGIQKFFSSPRFSRKLLRGKSPVPEKKKILKNKKSPPGTGSPLPETKMERKFLGSPLLGRAIFGSPKLPKHRVPDDVLLPKRIENNDRSDSCSSLSSLNSTSTSNSSFKPNFEHRQPLSIPCPQVGDSSTDEAPRSPSTPRTPVPSMGISVVIGKKRCSTPSSGESSLKSNSYLNSSTPLSSLNSFNTCTEPDDEDYEDYLLILVEKLRKAKLTIDGLSINQRRKRTMTQPSRERRKNKMILELRALERTLKAKEYDLKTLDDVLSSPLSSELLDDWVQKNSHLLPSDFEDSD